MVKEGLLQIRLVPSLQIVCESLLSFGILGSRCVCFFRLERIEEKRAALMEFLAKNPPGKLLRSPLADMKTFDGVKFVAEDSSWLMLRGSGTAPLDCKQLTILKEYLHGNC